MKKVKELSQKNEIYGNYRFAYDEPLLEYVAIMAEACHPPTEDDIKYGHYVSTAINNFAIRYFNDKNALQNRIDKNVLQNKKDEITLQIEKDNSTLQNDINNRAFQIKLDQIALHNRLDKSCKQKYENDPVLQDKIDEMEYDFHQFWYLLLFIYDYSHSLCSKGVIIDKSAKEQITDLINKILKNLKIDDFTGNPSGIKPMKIILEINGKSSAIIDNSFALATLVVIYADELKKIEDGSKMDNPTLKTKDGHFIYDPLKSPYLINHFANMLLKFFELKPPQKDHKIVILSDAKKYQFISEFIDLFGLSTKSFVINDDALEYNLKIYTDKKIDRFNNIYL